MNRTKTPTGARQPGSPGLDRLTQALIWTALVLAAAVAALSTDMLRTHAPVGSEAQSRAPTVEVTGMPGSVQSVTETPAPAFSPTTAPSATPSVSLTVAVVAETTPEPCVPPLDWDLYGVQEGNTLASIAQRFGADIDTLMRVNCLNTETVFADQRLYVPGPVPTPVPQSPVPTQSFYPGGTPGTGTTENPSDLGSQAQATPLPVPAVQGAMHLNIPNRYLNILLLGSDRRPNSGAWRTDSMIIVSVDTQDYIVRLLSIPRDLWVFIPGHGYDRINTADLWGELQSRGGGPERVKETIYYNLGIPIHYYIRVDFQGFIKIIDKVGGVDIEVDCPLPDIKLESGVYHMNGQQALRFSRSRKSTNDFDRGRRQRQVVMAVWEQALNLDLIPKLPSLWRDMSESFQTDLPLDQAINLAYVAVKLKRQNIMSRAIGAAQVQSWTTPLGAAVLLPRRDRVQALLESYYAPQATSGAGSGGRVRVQVLNAWERRDAEQMAASTLRWAGFQVAEAAVAEHRDKAKSQILVYTGNLTAASQIADELNLPSTAVQDLSGAGAGPNISGPIDIQVILGRDYNPCNR